MRTERVVFGVYWLEIVAVIPSSFFKKEDKFLIVSLGTVLEGAQRHCFPVPQDVHRQLCPDITKSRHIVHWEAKVPLEEGLRLTLDYLKTQVAAIK
jgi:nucleoside-diphosphate-sugar epimerase